MLVFMQKAHAEFWHCILKRQGCATMFHSYSGLLRLASLVHFIHFCYKPQGDNFYADVCWGSLSNLGYGDLQFSIKIVGKHKTTLYIKWSLVSNNCYKANAVHVLAKWLLIKNLQFLGKHVRRQHNISHLFRESCCHIMTVVFSLHNLYAFNCV